MTFIEQQLQIFKQRIEAAIRDGGADAKESIIRSSSLINLIHEAVKNEFIAQGIDAQCIYPHLGETKPEINLAGFLKKKNQDVCVVPKGVAKQRTVITWGPLAFENKVDPYGLEYSKRTLVVNVRSQMSSLAKNSDTLFERTFAEAQNLHMRYPEMVLGEVYLIPVHEYDDDLVKQCAIGFKQRQTNVEKYISFFNSINNREQGGPDYAYERCALLIVDFNREEPYLFKNSAELRAAGYISDEFGIEYSTLNFQNFARDILNIYGSRFDVNSLK